MATRTTRSGGGRRRVGLIASLVSTAMLAMALAACTTGSPATVSIAANPDLAVRCGLDVNLVIDRSGSIGSDMATVEQAAQTFVDLLSGTGSRVRTVSFSDTATAHPAGGAGTESIAALTWSSMEGYHVPDLAVGGGTNMDAGLEVARRAPGEQADLTLLFTDGKPNEHYLFSPNGHPGIWANLGYARSQAIAEANSLKAMGSHVFAIGVGEANAAVLADLTGPDAFGPTVPIEQADYSAVTSLGDLLTAFRLLAARLCLPSLTITKVVQDGAGGQSTAPGWTFDVSASQQPASWSQPPTGPSPMITGPSGSSTIVWNPLSGQTINFTVREVTQPGYQFGSVSCTVDLFDGNGPQPLPVISQTPFVAPVGPGEAVHCTVVNVITPPNPGAGGDLSIRIPQPPGEGEHPDVHLELFDHAGVSVRTATVRVGDRRTWTGLAGDTYRLKVTGVPSGWTLTDLACDGSSGDPATGLVDAAVHDASATACKVGVVRNLAISKVVLVTESATSGTGETATWSLTAPDLIPRERIIPLGQSGSWEVDPATYRLSQLSVAGKSVATDVSCDDGTHGPVSGISLTVPNGRTITCTAVYS